jgi:glycine/D-amino acid oxidase-like deaminating enzyme
MLTNYDVLVVGAGIFGITAALELNNRGHKVAVLDPGPLPHPLAASTDISKTIRMEYGADEAYMIMVERALVGWERWNTESAEKLYYNTGLTMLTRAPMAEGGYEYESYQTLLKRNHRPERLNSDDIARRFPAWKPGAFVDGFYHELGGFAESGRVVAWLAQVAEVEGVALYAGQTAQRLVEENGRVTGVQTQEGQTFNADHVLIAAGAWTPLLVPELAPFMRSSGHPVFHLKTADATLFTPPHFTVFTADVANSGWYGFPLHPREGVIKIANHGVGQQLHPSQDRRLVTDTDIRNLRLFLENTFPTLQEAAITYTRRCLYCDTLDEHLWIGNHPTKAGLTVAAGGSGHGFKFAPILGEIIADTIAGLPTAKFKWRDLTPETAGQEASRFHG